MSCRERWGIIASYEDAMIAGASVVHRSGIQRFIRDAPRGDFTVVLDEALDPICRNQAGWLRNLSGQHPLNGPSFVGIDHRLKLRCVGAAEQEVLFDPANKWRGRIRQRCWC